jgi:hypothetical protein
VPSDHVVGQELKEFADAEVAVVKAVHQWDDTSHQTSMDGCVLGCAKCWTTS